MVKSSSSFAIASDHKVLPFLASRARAYSAVLGSSVPNLWPFFRLPISYAGNYSVSLLMSMLNPPVKDRFMINPIFKGELGCLHWMGFFETGQLLP